MTVLQCSVAGAFDAIPNLEHHRIGYFLMVGIVDEVDGFTGIFFEVIEFVKIEPIKNKFPWTLPQNALGEPEA